MKKNHEEYLLSTANRVIVVNDYNQSLQQQSPLVVRVHSLHSILRTLDSFQRLLLKHPDDSNSNNNTIRKLFALLRESSHHLNLLIQSNSLLNLKKYYYPSPSHYLNPSIVLRNLPPDQRFPTTLHLIESISRHIGLESFQDSDHLLTIAGRLIVIDVETSSEETRSGSSNHVTRSKFSYTFDKELEPRRDSLIDSELTQLLSQLHLSFISHPPHSFCNIQNLLLVQNSLNGFTDSLIRLKELDELMSRFNHPSSNEIQSDNSSIDFFRVFRQLINDYHQSYKHATNQIQTTLRTRLPPTGIPLTSIDQFKLELIYHHPSNFNHPSNQNIPSNVFKLSILPTPLSTQQENYLNTSLLTQIPNHQGITKPNFTAYLYPPLVVSRNTAAKLATISSSSPTTFINHQDMTENSLTSTINEVWIDDLLVQNAMMLSSHHKATSENWLIKESNWKNQKFGKKFEVNEEGKRKLIIKQTYSFLEGTEVESGDLNHRVGFEVDRVGFNDLNSLLEIIKICQRQSLLNELFQSCFNRSCYIDQRNNQLFQDEKINQEDDFITFHTDNNNSNIDDLSLGQINASHVDKENINEILIDIMMNQSDYSLTIQFFLPTTLKTKNNNNDETKKNEENLKDEKETGMKQIKNEPKIQLISLKININENLQIQLFDFNQVIDVPDNSNFYLPSSLEPVALHPQFNSNSNDIVIGNDNDQMIIDQNNNNSCLLHNKEMLENLLILDLSIPPVLNLILQNLI